MSRQPTRFGLPAGGLTFNPDFKATKDDKGLWTGSITFTCRMEDVTNLLPKNGSPCQEAGFGFMKLVGLDVANNEGGTAIVTCKYSGTAPKEDEDDGVDEFTSSFNVSSNEEPIETHPRYNTGDSALSESERVVVADFKSGRLKPSKYDSETGNVTELITKVDDVDVGVVIVDNPALQELLGKILKGVVSYLDPRMVYRYTITKDTSPSGVDLNGSGTIGEPKGVETIGDRNWLLAGINYDYDGNIYTVSYEWLLSGLGGWDEDLYGTGE